jgi:hypothetical protein
MHNAHLQPAGLCSIQRRIQLAFRANFVKSLHVDNAPERDVMAQDNHDMTKEPMPFVIYRNNLEMFGRIVESSCQLSLAWLKGLERAEETIVAAMPDRDSASPFTANLIPSPDDLRNSAAAVASAMNDAARRRLDEMGDAERIDEPKSEAIIAPKTEKPAEQKAAPAQKPSNMQPKTDKPRPATTAPKAG